MILRNHDAFRNLGNVVCSICDKQLQGQVVKNEPCYVMMEEENVDGAYVCKNCGKDNGYEVAIEFVDYYNNCFRIVHKSVYQRSFHIDDILMDLSCEFNIKN